MTPRPVFRVIDTGIRPGQRHMAFDEALIEARAANEVPDTIRFLRFRPTVLVGRHQVLRDEVKRDYCAANGIDVGRRITGGGAIYLDEGQLGWEFVFDRHALEFGDLTETTRRLCEACCTGLQRLGVAAAYRPRNDIEVDGRKLGGTGGFFDGRLVSFQGTVLLDVDPVRMVSCLNVAADKLAKHGAASIADRMVSLAMLGGGTAPPVGEVMTALLNGFAETLGIDPVRGEITEGEEARAAELFDHEIGTAAFIEGEAPPAASDAARGHSFTAYPGGRVRVDLRFEGAARDRIADCAITGDFFVTPARAIRDIEASLRRVPVAEIETIVMQALTARGVDFIGLTAAQLIGSIRSAAESRFEPHRLHEMNLVEPSGIEPPTS